MLASGIRFDLTMQLSTPTTSLTRFTAWMAGPYPTHGPTPAKRSIEFGILKEFRSPFAATVVTKIEAAGLEIRGKSNLDEFGMGSDSLHSVHGPVRNMFKRHEQVLSAGGSSGGSAVAVAAGYCDAAIGTDTGGSVRLPAAYTGLVGFKPSYGMISRWGVTAYANSLDTVGVLARSSDGVRELFGIVKGYDHRDPTSIQLRATLQQEEGSRNSSRHSNLRIGVPLEYNVAELEPIVRRAWVDVLQKLQQKGHQLLSVSLPTTKEALPAYYVIAPAEASSNLARYDGVRYGTAAEKSERGTGPLFSGLRGSGFGHEARRRILLGSYSLSAAAFENYFIQAQKVRRLVQQDFNRVFDRQHPLFETEHQARPERVNTVDVLVTPTVPSLPPQISDVQSRSSVSAYSADVFTVPASLAGIPAINVPVRLPSNNDRDVEDVPSVGIQVIGQYGDDTTVFAAAKAIEDANEA